MLAARLVILVFLLVYVSAQRTEDLTFMEQEPWRPTTHQNSMLADIAKEVYRRSSSTSQILNLNLSNLLLLLVLKAFVYGAGFFRNHGYSMKARSEPATVNRVITEGEMALAMGYLIGDTCLYRAACEVPQTASEYLGAAEMLLQTFKLIPQSKPIDESYEKTMSEFRKAIDVGSRGQCPPEYNCKKENIHKFFQPV